MSVGSYDLSTQPLAELLQNTCSLTQLVSTSSDVRKKRRPEVIDIHRTKDVSTAQPVSLLSSSLFFMSLLILLRSQVRHHKPRFSPSPFSPSLFWTLFYTLPPPYLSASSKSKPAAHNSTPKLHFSHNLPLSPPSWQQNIPLWSSPLFSCLGLEYWKGRESITGDWAWRHTEQYGALQPKPVWPLDRFCGLWPKRWWHNKCS